LLIIDEAAEVFGLEQFDLNSLGASIARMGRAAGVLMLIATQHPTNEALASTQLTKNLRRRFCFSVEDDAAQRAIIPKSSGRFDATDIPIGAAHVGTYYSSEGGEICDLSRRVRYVTPVDVYRIVLEVGAEGSPVAVTDLDPLSAEAARRATTDPETGISAYAERRIWTVYDAIAPEDWTGPNMDDIAGPRVPTPVPAPTAPGAPAPVSHQAAGPAPADTKEDPVVPWTDNDPPMNIDDIALPRTPQEVQSLEEALAAYAAKNAEADMTPAQAQEMLDRLLNEAPPEGIAIRHIREVVPRSASWVSDQLRRRMVAQPAKVVKVGERYVRPAKRLVSVGRDDHSQ